MKKKRPNILFLFSDEHSPNTLGCMGSEFVKTPNLDRLAASGTIFENAYTPFALCVPARAALMSGLECHKMPCYDDGSSFSSDLPTWAHMLARDGYRTILDGKMHFRGPDQLHGFQEHWNERSYDINGYRWGEENPTGMAYQVFSKINLIDDPMEHDLSKKDRIRVDSAISYLNEADKEQPFCLTVGFIYPHYPMVCDRKIYDSYADCPIPGPVHGESLHPRNDHFANKVWGYNKFTNEETINSRRAYLTMVTMLDGWIGEILDALDANGLTDDTIIIYSSDHGDMWGEHNCWGKNTFYDDSAKVPLIVSGKRFGIKENQRIKTPVSLLDLYPTFRDMAGIDDWMVPLDGRSLWPALIGEGALTDQPVFSEYYSCDTKGPERMVRYKNFKLNFYYRQGMELFDLESDPHEQINREADPDYQEIKNELLEMLLKNWDPDKIYRDIVIDQNRRTLLGEAIKKCGTAAQTT